MAEMLTTQRLILRRPLPEEAADIMVLADNRRIAGMTARLPHPYGLGDALAFIAACAASPAGLPTFGIYRKARRPDFIGTCGLAPLGQDPGAELGYWIGEPHWGRGYAGEAASAVLALAFDGLGLPRLQAGCRPDNPASRAVLEKLGFRHRGTGTIYAANRRRREMVDRFLLTADAWREGAGP